MYNFGGENQIRNIDLAQQIIEMTNPGVAQVEFVSDRLGHDFKYAIDHKKSIQELSWAPKRTFAQGLKDTVHWYRQQLQN